MSWEGAIMGLIRTSEGVTTAHAGLSATEGPNACNALQWPIGALEACMPFRGLCASHVPIGHPRAYKLFQGVIRP